MSENTKIDSYDLKRALTDNQVAGLWKMMTGFHATYVGATTSLAISALSKTATYLLLRYFIDNIIGKPGLRYLLPWIAAGFIGLAVAEGTFSYISGRLAAFTAEGIAKRTRNYLYDHLQRLSFSFHDKTPTGEMIQRSTSDVDALRRFFSEQAIGVGRILLLFTINFIAIFRLNARLALISVIAIPPIVVISIWFFRRITKAYEAYQEQDAILSTTVQENLTGVRVVKAFARQKYEVNKFNDENWKKFLRGRKLLMMHSLFWPISDIIAGAQMLGGFIAGAIMTINGTITIGTYLAYAGLVIWLIWPMRNLGRLIVQLSTGLVSYQRIMKIIAEEREPLTSGDHVPDGSLEGRVSFQNLSFEYDPESPVLKDITFECEPGQVVAILGSTGSGKTTLVNLLPRFYEYTNGKLLLDAVDIKRYPKEYLRTQVSIVEQEPFLFSRTIRENITYGIEREVSDNEVEEVSRASAIHDVILNFPDGYNTLVGEKGVTLSGGQKQRVAIARTILKDPRILILDDSTSSVDPETEAEIRSALRKLMEGRTSFVIAHRIQSVMYADLILVMDQGKIVQMGSHKELVREDGIYRQIFDIQTRIEDELEQEISQADSN